jgi:hypothetical protein
LEQVGAVVVDEEVLLVALGLEDLEAEAEAKVSSTF